MYMMSEYHVYFSTQNIYNATYHGFSPEQHFLWHQRCQLLCPALQQLCISLRRCGEQVKHYSITEPAS